MPPETGFGNIALALPYLCAGLLGRPVKNNSAPTAVTPRASTLYSIGKFMISPPCTAFFCSSYCVID